MTETPTGEVMVGWGPKQAWLAIGNDDAESPTVALLCEYLGLDDLGTVAWRAGIDLVHFTDDRLVVTPRLEDVRGGHWLLVVGRWLARTGASFDIEELSAVVGSAVQFFATDRVQERHRWQRAEDGKLLRSFDYLGRDGEILDWQGDPDAAELALGLPSMADDESDLIVGESDVLRLAGVWSIDPAMLDGQPAPGPVRVAAVARV